MRLTKRFYQSFLAYSGNNAFCVDNTYYTYKEFLGKISSIWSEINTKQIKKESPIGIVCFDEIETYAAIFATWFSGRGIVPLNPKFPVARNKDIITKSGTNTIISAREGINQLIENSSITAIFPREKKVQLNSIKLPTLENQLYYILTTSGSTGTPKYVPIYESNVDAYCDGFFQLFPELEENVNFLQTYDLTSDAAYTGFLMPLLRGACIYTVPDNQFKFLSISKLMMNKRINWVKLTPSVLAYLTEYKNRMSVSHIKKIFFGGEPLTIKLIEQWEKSFPKSEIINLYGPTETTISSHAYRFKSSKMPNELNGIISIGKPFPKVECIIIDNENQKIKPKEKGELCIGGKQVMSNYLNLTIGNNIFHYDSTGKKYYKTGDLVQKDEDGYYYFLGRIDDQVKVQGYRINLIEVEHAAKSILKDQKVIAVASEKAIGIKRLYLFIVNYKGDCQELKQKLCKKLPPQMVPEEIISIKDIPFTASGKTDRKTLEKLYLNDESD